VAPTLRLLKKKTKFLLVIIIRKYIKGEREVSEGEKDLNK
jgi:hypothetical protein